MPVIIPRLVIYRRRIISVNGISSEIYIFLTVFLYRRNRGLSANSSLRGTDNYFCPGAIRRRNKCSGKIKKEAAKAWSTKSKANIVI